MGCASTRRPASFLHSVNTSWAAAREANSSVRAELSSIVNCDYHHSILGHELSAPLAPIVSSDDMPICLHDWHIPRYSASP